MWSRVNASLEHIFLDFENNCVKVNTYRPILKLIAAVVYSPGTLVSGNIKSNSHGFSKKETSNDSVVARHAHMLPSHAEVYSLSA